MNSSWFNIIRFVFLSLTTSYQWCKTWWENRQPPPGQLIEIEGRKIHFSSTILRPVKCSFYRPQHWLTMAREIWNLDKSSRQLKIAKNLQDIPLVSLKANSFFKPSPWNFYLPLQQVEQFREKMHINLLQLSTNSRQISASQSSHFIWIDEPQLIITAIDRLIEKIP